MYDRLLPFGEPIYFDDEYKEDKIYPLYIQMLTCSFKIKKNKIPTIQFKHSLDYMSNEYVTSTNDEIECLVLTNVDYKLFKEQYDVKNEKFIGGWKFKGIHDIFNSYIDKWIEQKNQATIEGNKGQRTLCKLMLNSLYGKFAKSINTRSKQPIIDDEGILHYPLTEEEHGKGLYIPIASFITAYAREITIRTSQAITDYSLNKYGVDKYLYSDTDSIHCLLNIEEVKQICNIDDVKLGYWKHEGTFTKARFIRQKTYIEEINNEIQITCAGMPKTCYNYVNWKNFKTGLTVDGKLTFKHVKGGVILIPTQFTLKEEKITNHIKQFKANTTKEKR